MLLQITKQRYILAVTPAVVISGAWSSVGRRRSTQILRAHAKRAHRREACVAVVGAGRGQARDLDLFFLPSIIFNYHVYNFL